MILKFAATFCTASGYTLAGSYFGLISVAGCKLYATVGAMEPSGGQKETMNCFLD